MKLYMKLFLTIYLSQAIFINQIIAADSALVDRMIVKIKGESHSQWEIESYILVKQSLDIIDKKNLNPQLRITSQAQWQTSLSEYINHVSILDQVQKRGGGALDKAATALKLKEFKELLQGNSKLNLWHKELGLTEKQLKKQINNLLIVEANKSSQIRRADESKDDPIDRQSKLYSQGEIHYYQDALTYEPIRR